MAIKIIKHKEEPEEMAYKFSCDCGCEFWADADEADGTIDEVSSCGYIFLYQTKCPECGCTVSMTPDFGVNVVPRNEIFDE